MMNVITYLFGAAFATVAIEALIMTTVFLAPFAVFALLIHFFELITQKRLAERFGWNAVLWTGWLGTPVHELSHVVMCRIFGHRVDEVALFEPDPESGRLGYVRHSYRRENWFDNFGNLFIGIAPLIGGSLVLIGLLWLFFPDAAMTGLKAQSREQELKFLLEEEPASAVFSQTLQLSLQIARELFSIQHLATFRFWLFLYLVLCVGSHMAPSGSDYRGAARGAVITLCALVGITFFLALVGVPVDAAVHSFLTATSPLFTVLALTVMLCGLATMAVFLATSLLSKRFVIR
jgi:hypothetical protein